MNTKTLLRILLFLALCTPSAYNYAEAGSKAQVASNTFQDRLSNDMPGPEMVVIPAGSFIMGSKDGDSAERPIHKVTIAKIFALGKHEVTQAQWVAVMGDNPSHLSGCNDCPVESVSWDKVQDFISKLNRQTGKTYRLPSDAEWEYAARAGSTSRYHWGDSIGLNNANCEGCGNQIGVGKSAPVGSFKPNAFGLYDMSGNVWEWVQDCWNATYQDAPSDGSAWTQGDCSRRVIRGGSWGNRPGLLRSTLREWFEPSNHHLRVGFRLAQDL